MKEKEKLSWLEPCDGANIRTCLQTLSTDTQPYYTNTRIFYLTLFGCEFLEDNDQAKHVGARYGEI